MSHDSSVFNKRPVYDNGSNDAAAPRHLQPADNDTPLVNHTPHAPAGPQTFPGADAMKGPRQLWYWVLCISLSVLIGVALAELFDYLN